MNPLYDVFNFVKFDAVGILTMPTKLMFSFDLIFAYPSSTFLHVTCTAQFIYCSYKPMKLILLGSLISAGINEESWVLAL